MLQSELLYDSALRDSIWKSGTPAAFLLSVPEKDVQDNLLTWAMKTIGVPAEGAFRCTFVPELPDGGSSSTAGGAGTGAAGAAGSGSEGGGSFCGSLGELEELYLGLADPMEGMLGRPTMGVWCPKDARIRARQDPSARRAGQERYDLKVSCKALLEAPTRWRAARVGGQQGGSGEGL